MWVVINGEKGKRENIMDSTVTLSGSGHMALVKHSGSVSERHRPY